LSQKGTKKRPASAGRTFHIRRSGGTVKSLALFHEADLAGGLAQIPDQLAVVLL